jgi:hypothetical protein
LALQLATASSNASEKTPLVTEHLGESVNQAVHPPLTRWHNSGNVGPDPTATLGRAAAA